MELILVIEVLSVNHFLCSAIKYFSRLIKNANYLYLCSLINEIEQALK
jgi:hypothetical protein